MVFLETGGAKKKETMDTTTMATLYLITNNPF
jgi:hypothetical protein